MASSAEDAVDLDTVADELYGLRPEDFTAARDARAAEARGAGDRTLAAKIGKLRRPGLAAWASNLLVRERPDATRPLLQLGEGLRQAHRDLDGAQLRELSRRQHGVINALARQARQLAAQAGHPISEGVQHEVETILQAVLADPEAAQEWATGRLVKGFAQVAGFPPAAEDAIARPAPVARKPASRPAVRRDARAGEEGRRRLEQARQDAEDAERALKARQEEAAAADRQVDEAQARAQALEQRINELTEELQRLEEDRRQAQTAARKAREHSLGAERRVRQAQRRAETAAAQVKRLSA
ncbi:hypothetical protein [Streptomyces sp. NPDC001401]|uniref:hypothetical protein n=1 Tax=Streptomyces sp. NPDC001401 TaxID=3364570 RepID=UPI00368FD36D